MLYIGKQNDNMEIYRKGGDSGEYLFIVVDKEEKEIEIGCYQPFCVWVCTCSG